MLAAHILFRRTRCYLSQLKINNKILFYYQIIMKVSPNEARATDTGTPFCFKYFINLGNNRYGSMTITDKTNLYSEAETFCKHNELQPYIAVVLENQMFQQVLRMKEELAVKVEVSSKPTHVVNHISKATKCIRPAIIHDHNENSQNQGPAQIGGSASTVEHKLSCRHFEEMFQRHAEIESKKQMSRKASFDKIPFKPHINNLSRKIVDLKRKSVLLDNQNISKPPKGIASRGKSKPGKALETKSKTGQLAQQKRRIS